MKFNKYLIMLGLAVISATLTTSCSRDEIITEMSFDRLFSALGLEARVINQVDVRLNWTEVEGAKSYIVNVYESINQEGEVDDATDNTKFVKVPEGASPVRTIETTKTKDVVIQALTGQTRYVFEVIAVDADGGRSKGICVEAKTGSEQTFRTVLDTEIEAKSVILRWNALDAEGCTIKIQVEGEEGYVVQHVVTAEEAAAQCCLIDGLVGETTYVAYMKNTSNKQRGEITFTTAVDLGGAIAVNPGDNLNKVIEAAEDGATLALFPGTYECTNEEGAQVKIKVEKSISIKAARAAERPVIKGCIQLYNGASLTLSQVVMDGTGSDGSQAIDVKSEGNYSSLIVDDCEIMNYTKGLFYINVAAVIDHVVFNNCLIHNIECSGGDFFDSRSGGYNKFDITNNTIWNSAASRDFIRMDDASSKVIATPVINIDHNTLYNVGNGNSNYRLLYVRFAGHSISFTNNIVAGFNNKRGFANQKTTAVPTFSGNYYYKSTNLISAGPDADTSITFFDEAGKEITSDPFVDASKADFTLTDEDMKFYGAGAQRWR